MLADAMAAPSGVRHDGRKARGGTRGGDQGRGQRLGNLAMWLVQLCVIGGGCAFAGMMLVAHRRQQ